MIKIGLSDFYCRFWLQNVSYVFRDRKDVYSLMAINYFHISKYIQAYAVE